MFASTKARLFALHCRETIYNRTFQAPRPRLGLSPGPAYGTALQRNKLQRNILGASAKANLLAWPGIWHYIVGKQPAMKHSRCLDQGQACRPARPMALHYGKTICNETIVSPLVEPCKVSTYLLDCLVASHRCANQQRCLQEKKVYGVLRDAIRCVRA